MELMFQPLRKYADFQGRARRSEYWLFYLFVVIVYVLVGIVTGAAMGAPGDFGIGQIILGVIGLAFLVPTLAVGVRRLHDTNRSGWWLLIGLIPFLGALVLLIFFVLDGTPGANRFGEDPKARTAETFA
jgi:uncharacterized membrane protein YhaH (DUF805 family)